MCHTDKGRPQIHPAQPGLMKEMLASIWVGFFLFQAALARAVISNSNRPDGIANTVSDQTNLSNHLSVLCFSMNTGLIIAVIFLGLILLINRGSEITEHLMEFIDHMNERKHVHRKRVPTRIKKLKKLRVVKTLTDGQIPQVKKQIKEISRLIKRHRDTIYQLRDAAVTCVGRSGLTAGLVQYEKGYARQLNMINTAIPRLIAEADRISAVDQEYKQRIHHWILAMRKSLEDCDPKYFEQMIREDHAHHQKSTIDKTQASL